jgi:hypothetical protein
MAATYDQKRRIGGGSFMIKIYHDYEALSNAAAKLFADEARLAVQARGRFTVALSRWQSKVQ